MTKACLYIYIVLSNLHWYSKSFSSSFSTILIRVNRILGCRGKKEEEENGGEMYIKTRILLSMEGILSSPLGRYAKGRILSHATPPSLPGSNQKLPRNPFPWIFSGRGRYSTPTTRRASRLCTDARLTVVHFLSISPSFSPSLRPVRIVENWSRMVARGGRTSVRCFRCTRVQGRGGPTWPRGKMTFSRGSALASSQRIVSKSSRKFSSSSSSSFSRRSRFDAAAVSSDPFHSDWRARARSVCRLGWEGSGG